MGKATREPLRKQPVLVQIISGPAAAKRFENMTRPPAHFK